MKVPFAKTFKFHILLLGLVGWALPLIIAILGVGFFSRHLKADFDYSLENIKAREGLRLREEQEAQIRSQMRQKAMDVAQELSLYLLLQKSRSWPEIFIDPQFQQIAVQPVADLGETFLMDAGTGKILLNCCIPFEGGTVVNLWRCPSLAPALEAVASQRIGTFNLKEIKLPNTGSPDYYGFLVPVPVRPEGGPALVAGALADLKEMHRHTDAASSILKTAVNLSRALIDVRISLFQREAFVFFGGLGILGVLACLALIRRQTRAMAGLTRAAEAYNQGDLDYRIPDPGQDELGRLARTLNQMAASLQENTVSRTEWENTFNIIPDQVMILDAQQRIVRINQAAADFAGVTPEEATGRLCFEIMHLNTPPPPACGFARTIKMGVRTQMEFYSVERRATFMVSVDPLKDREGTVVGAVHVARDITALKRVQGKLSRTSQFLQQIIESAPLAVAVVNAEGRYSHVNPQFSAEYGYSPEDILQKRYSALYADKKEMLQLMRELQEHGEILSKRVRIKHKDGRTVPARLSIRVLWGADGKLLGSVAMGRNISDEAILQNQMEMVQKLEAVAILSGGLAHNFNNLLTVIMGLTNLMLAKIDPGHPFYGDLQEIASQVRAGRELTENLLTFAQDTRFERQSLALNQLIQGTVDIFARTRRDIRVKLDLDPALPPVEADPGQMQQVLMNLLINAWQAMPQGGEISLRTRGEVISEWQDPLWELDPGRYVSFAVVDQGVGMDEQTRQHIFEPLFTTKPPGQGTGLGLASVYHIVKSHRGAVKVDSQKGRGSTFTIFLPASKHQPDRAAPAEAAVTVYGQGTIMVVDDEPVLRGVAARLLEKLGYGVIQAQDGETAVAAFREHRAEISLVLMDMVMPGMSGLQAIERLRAINPRVPIILCTGYGDSRGKALPSDVGYLSKPYTLELLSQKVAASLGN